MIVPTEAQELKEQWRLKFGDDVAFERSWSKYWQTATAPDATRLEAWLQRDYDCLKFASQNVGEPARPVFRNAIGRPLEYIHAELQICPLCQQHFDASYLEHTSEKHRVHAEPDISVNNLHFPSAARTQRYLDACAERETS